MSDSDSSDDEAPTIGIEALGPEAASALAAFRQAHVRPAATALNFLHTLSS